MKLLIHPSKTLKNTISMWLMFLQLNSLSQSSKNNLSASQTTQIHWISLNNLPLQFSTLILKAMLQESIIYRILNPLYRKESINLLSKLNHNNPKKNNQLLPNQLLSRNLDPRERPTIETSLKLKSIENNKKAFI